jgi:hypothetical protein
MFVNPSLLKQARSPLLDARLLGDGHWGCDVDHDTLARGMPTITGAAAPCGRLA